MNHPVVIFILGQAFGILALICTVVSMQIKKKRPLMILQTISEAFIVAQYIVKGAITGSFMAVVSFIRDIIFTKYDKKQLIKDNADIEFLVYNDTEFSTYHITFTGLPVIDIYTGGGGVGGGDAVHGDIVVILIYH